MGCHFSKDSIVVAHKKQVSSDLAGEAVILSLKNYKYYGLNSVGARIWNLIQNPMPLGEISGILLREYAVEPGRCESDLLVLLEKLAEEGLIEVR